MLQLPEPFANTPHLSRRDLSRYDEAGPAWAWSVLELGEWDGLLFLQHVVRWARRFAHFKSGELREFRRINYQYPFCVAVVDAAVSGPEALIYDVLEDLGVSDAFELAPSMVDAGWTTALLEGAVAGVDAADAFDDAAGDGLTVGHDGQRLERGR